MTRPALFVLFYAFVGTIVAMVGYRLVLHGPLAAPAQERSLDGLVLFITILLNTALIFAAAGLTAIIVYPIRHSVVTAVVASVIVAAVVSYLMTLWFRGLSLEFPLIVALSALVCGVLARAMRLFRIPGLRGR
jgi:hypothetical protein